MVKNLTKANDLLKKSSSQLAEIETLAALTDMTSGLAHDFNNTIGGIVGRVQLMQLKVKDETILDGLNKIEKTKNIKQSKKSLIYDESSIIKY